MLFPLEAVEGLEKNLYFDAAERQAARRRQESSVKCGCASTVEGARAADLSAITADIRMESRSIVFIHVDRDVHKIIVARQHVSSRGGEDRSLSSSAGVPAL